FGEVFIDGGDAGQTPLVEYAVKPGRHTIRLEHAGFKTVTEAVLADASNTVRKRHTLLPERPGWPAGAAPRPCWRASPSRRPRGRQLRIATTSFVGGRGAVPNRFTVTQPARVVTRAIGGAGAGSYVIDSGAWNGQVNLSWPARLANGDPVPAGNYTVVVEARLGQNAFSASQPIRVSHGSVDTLPSLTSLPGYQYLPETEVPPQSWRPLGLAFLYTGGAL